MSHKSQAGLSHPRLRLLTGTRSRSIIAAVRYRWLITLILFYGCTAVPQASQSQSTESFSPLPSGQSQPTSTSTIAPSPTAVRTDPPPTPSSGQVPEADLAGTFLFNTEVHGCSSALREAAGETWSVAWPEGYTVRAAGDGSYELIDPAGATAARTGDYVGVNGSESEFSVCMAGPNFVATDVIFVVPGSE